MKMRKIFYILNKITFNIYWIIHQKYIGYEYKYTHGEK